MNSKATINMVTIGIKKYNKDFGNQFGNLRFSVYAAVIQTRGFGQVVIHLIDKVWAIKSIQYITISSDR